MAFAVGFEGAAVLGGTGEDHVGLADRDLWLVQSPDAIHAVGQQDAVPVDRRVLGQFVGDEDTNAIAFDSLDRGTRRRAVVAPAVDEHAGRELALDGLRDEVEFLDAIVHAPRQ